MQSYDSGTVWKTVLRRVILLIEYVPAKPGTPTTYSAAPVLHNRSSPRKVTGMPRVFLKDCQPGDLIEDVFALTGKQIAAGSNGKQYIKAMVGDRSMTVNARIWNATPKLFAELPSDGFVRLRGRIENYQSNLQVIIEQTWPAKAGTYEVADLIAHTTRDIPEMFARLTGILGTIRNKHLKALIDAYLADEDLMTNFRHAPAAMNFHHAFLGGLLEHTLNAVEVSDAVCPFYPGLNRDVVVAGIFLHDIAKTWELTYETAFAYSDGGQLIGHIVKAAMWVEDKRRTAEAKLGEKIPQALIDVIQHIILSHHGETEFGSPKVPATPEALVVHALENLDAKLMMALSATRGDQPAGVESNWTEYLKAFGGRMYRPDVAPPDPGSPPLPAPASRSTVSSNAEDSPTMKLSITNPLFESLTAKRR
jgi:3'-5' exoribonuclease